MHRRTDNSHRTPLFALAGLLAGMLSAAGLCRAAAAPLAVREYTGGAGGTPADAPSGVLARPAGAPDAGRLEIGGDVRQFDLLTIEVAPSTKYRLDLRARLDGGETVERNDRAHNEALRQNARWNSVYEVVFGGGDDDDDEAGKSHGGFILTGEWHDYVHVFHTPPGARKLTIRITPRGHTTLVARVALTPADEGGAINANPDFRYGELNYCGWRPQRDGRIYRRPDGKCVFNAGYGGSSPRFPLQPGKSYTATALGEGGQVTLNYFDDHGGKTSGRFLLRPAPEGVQTTFTPPEGTAAGSIVMYGGTVLESFKVEESGAPATNNPQE